MGKNKEGYTDPTASIAVGRAAKHEKKEGGKEECSCQSETQEWTKNLTVWI